MEHYAKRISTYYVEPRDECNSHFMKDSTLLFIAASTIMLAFYCFTPVECQERCHVGRVRDSHMVDNGDVLVRGEYSSTMTMIYFWVNR